MARRRCRKGFHKVKVKVKGRMRSICRRGRG